MARRRRTKGRTVLIERANQAGRELSAATVMFHTALAARRGLTATEEKALDLLLREGPMGHAELGRATGLAAASVTNLIDRLERKGYAERQPDPSDRRRVLVAALPEPIYADLAPLFAGFVASLEELYDKYDDEELERIVGFVVEAAERQRAATDQLTQSSPGG